MIGLKNTERSSVRLGFNGSVYKHFRGQKAQERMQNEVNVLQYLESRECGFVPRLLDFDFQCHEIVLSNCGYPVQHLTQLRLDELFASLREYGVEHEDPELRNVTYRPADGVFCVVDFEFATILTSSPLLQLDKVLILLSSI